MTRQEQLDHLRAQIELGLDQANCGELLDGEEVFEDLEKRFGVPAGLDEPLV